MPADSVEHSSIEQQALHAIRYLGADEQHKILKYIESLLTLKTAKDDQRSAT
jgi:hypothetical protein